MCPVKSFMKYKKHLNSKCDKLFQKPNKRFSPICARWYDNAPLGQNPLGEMMPNISQKAGLSRRYTNYSLRATSVYLLDSIGKYANRHIMTVTGHKSETSLKTYTGYTDSKIKRSMSDTISGSLRSESPKREKLVLKDSNVSETDITLDDVKLTLEPLTNSQYNTLLGDLDDEFDNLTQHENIAPVDTTTAHVENVAPVNMTSTRTTTLNVNSSRAMLPFSVSIFY